MKCLLWGVAAVAVMVAVPATIGAVDSKPIDTKTLVVKPTKAVADLTAATINMAGQTAASQLDKNGYVKTINNLFRKPTPTTIQPGPSPLPLPTLFPSTRYPNYNTPVMPTVMPARR
ncbi:MAG TPA: hypothetical protein VKE74_14825 [Gemmataceae bacterium]|nr:hypothetical protein [Gemmataceae bacterium]